jgi:hypothetical protein
VANTERVARSRAPRLLRSDTLPHCPTRFADPVFQQNPAVPAGDGCPLNWWFRQIAVIQAPAIPRTSMTGIEVLPTVASAGWGYVNVCSPRAPTAIPGLLKPVDCCRSRRPRSAGYRAAFCVVMCSVVGLRARDFGVESYGSKLNFILGRSMGYMRASALIRTPACALHCCKDFPSLSSAPNEGFNGAE